MALALAPAGVTVVGFGLAGLALGGLAWAHGATQAILFGLGMALGATLWWSSFSFAGAWRRLVLDGVGGGVRAQCVLVGLSTCLFLPLIEAGEAFGQPVRGFVFPVGWALLVGAFLFGIGMQLGGGCGSGTLYSAGAGAGRSWLTLAAFIAGATLAAWGAELWLDWPALAPIALTRHGGMVGVIAATVLILGGAHLLIRRREHALPVHTERWSPMTGAVVLAGLGVLVLVVAGRPWAITAAFPLWGSKLIDRLGLDDPAFWPFWDDPTRTEALLRPLLLDRTTVMDLGLLAGAFLAASWWSRGSQTGAQGSHGPAPSVRAPRAFGRLAALGPAVAAVLGGGLMGIGAVLASGCNISAFVGGIASGSAHGWVWMIAALPGILVGIRMRRWFRLT